MKKNEWVYREILHGFIEKNERFFTQSALSKKCGVSIGNVNKALSVLDKINAIEKKSRGFIVINWKKLLLYWASNRNLERDIVYQTNVGKSVNEIERGLPPVMFTAYSGYKFVFKVVPADYSEVVVYADDEKIRERFGRVEGKRPKPLSGQKHGGKPNLIVLKMDPHLRKFRKVPLAQIYVDLWNLGTWYAEDFLKELEKKMERVTGKGGD